MRFFLLRNLPNITRSYIGRLLKFDICLHCKPAYIEYLPALNTSIHRTPASIELILTLIPKTFPLFGLALQNPLRNSKYGCCPKATPGEL